MGTTSASLKPPAGSLNEAYRRYCDSPGEQTLEEVARAGKGLVLHFARQYPGFPAEDLCQTGMVGLLQAAHSYKPSRGTAFATWASACILGEIRHYIRAECRDCGVLCGSDDALEDLPAPDDMTSLDEKAELQKAIERLQPLERKVLNALFYDGLSQEQTAAALGLHQRKVSRIRQKALTCLKRELDKPNFKLVKDTKSFHRL